jgi:hypothetical protein
VAKEERRDRSLDTLLDLDGETMFVDREGRCWAKFEVKRVEATKERPHGLKYSLTLHDENGQRLVGYDNAHAVSATKGPGKRARKEHDHKHRLKTVRPYDYKDAGSLLEDFWSDVDAVLKERGVLE